LSRQTNGDHPGSYTVADRKLLEENGSSYYVPF
jgi:hypothetical protein